MDFASKIGASMVMELLRDLTGDLGGTLNIEHKTCHWRCRNSTAMFKRSNTKVTDGKGSHVIYMSQPDAVAKVIIEAAGQVG